MEMESPLLQQQEGPYQESKDYKFSVGLFVIMVIDQCLVVITNSFNFIL